jgi:hypothetical protein
MSGAPEGFTRYRGTKELFARPMPLREYNEYRGWDMSGDENPDALGYLVEYVDGGKPNHPKHIGYISWSPLDVFETTFADRMRIELHDLNEKLSRLQVFIGTERFNALPADERQDQRAQLLAMQQYSEVLTRRLVRATK